MQWWTTHDVQAGVQHQSMVSSFYTQLSWSGEGPQSRAGRLGAMCGWGEVWKPEVDLEYLLLMSTPFGHVEAWGGAVPSLRAA